MAVHTNSSFISIPLNIFFVLTDFQTVSGSAYHPAASSTPNGNSAVALSITGGVSTNYSEWGQDMTVEASYTGPHIKWPLTLKNVQQVLHHIRTKPEISIHKKYVAETVGKAAALMNQQLKDSVYDMAVPPGPDSKLVICGDTHGQLADFLWVLKQNGEPSPTTAYLLNGDVADRGDDASEILMIVLLYKLLYPDNIMINRCVRTQESCRFQLHSTGACSCSIL